MPGGGKKDPRIGLGPDTLNAELRDELIRHAILILGLEAGEARRLRLTLSRDLDPVVMEALQDALGRFRVDDAGRVERAKQTLQAMETFSAEQAAAVRAVFDERRRDFRARMRELAEGELRYSEGVLDFRVPVDFDVRSPPPIVITDIVSRRPIEGRPLDHWFRDLAADTSRRIDAEVRRGIASNESTAQIIQRVRGTTRRPGGPLLFAKRQAETIARTAVRSVSTAALEEVWSANSDVVERVMIVATLDLRTCPICASLDGASFPVGNGDRPPFHPSCRCVVAPVVAAFDDLGRRVRRSGADDGTRASMLGEVPSTLRFPEWIRRQRFDDLVEVFGRQRAVWIRDGLIDPRELIDRQLRIRTLEELRPLISRRRAG